MRSPGTPSQSSSEGCLVLEVHSYAPPAELAASYALWACVGIAVALMLYLLVCTAQAWFRRSDDSWLEGYETGRRARFDGDGLAMPAAAEADRQNVTPFPGSPAA